MTMQGLLHTTWHLLFNSHGLMDNICCLIKTLCFCSRGRDQINSISSNFLLKHTGLLLLQGPATDSNHSKGFWHWNHEGFCLMGFSEDFQSVRKMQKFEATWNNDGDWQPAWEVWFDGALTHLAAWNLWRLLPRIPVKRMLQPFCLEH